MKMQNTWKPLVTGALALSLGLLAACQNPVLQTAPALPTGRVQAVEKAVPAPLEAQMRFVQLEQGFQLQISLAPQALQTFRTQAVACTAIESLNILVTGPGISTPITGSATQNSTGSCEFTSSALPNIPVGAFRLVEVQALDANSNIIAQLKTAMRIAANATSQAEASHRTSPVARMLEHLISLGAQGEAYATQLSLIELQDWVNGLAGVSGTFPNFTYTHHPALLRADILAQAIVANGGSIPASPPANHVRETGSLNLNISNIEDSELDVMLSDPASSPQNLSTPSSSEELSFSNVIPGIWQLTIKNGSTTRQLNVTIPEGDALTLTVDLQDQSGSAFDYNWQTMTGPGAAKVTGLVSDNNNGMQFVATTGGVYRLDSGTWMAVNDGLDDIHITAMGFGTDGTSIHIVYVATRNGKVWRRNFAESESTWTQVGSAEINSSAINMLYAMPGNPLQLYAGTEDAGLYECSYTLEEDWSSVNLGLPTGPFPSIRDLLYSASENRFYLATQLGIYLTNAGDSPGDGWNETLFNSGLSAGDENVSALLESSSIVKIATRSGKVFRSDGSTWIGASTDLPANLVAEALLLQGSDYFLATNLGLLKAADTAGIPQAWQSVRSGSNALPPDQPSHRFLRHLADAGGGSMLVGSDGAGVDRVNTSNGVWTPELNGLRSAQVSAILKTSFTNGVLYVGTTGGGLHRHFEGNWSRWLNVPDALSAQGQDRYLTSLAARPDGDNHDLYMGTAGAGVLCQNDLHQSSNPNTSWSAVGTGVDKPEQTLSLLMLSNHQQLVAGANDGVYLLDIAGSDCDATTSWAKDLNGNSIHSLAQRPGSAGYVYAGRSNTLSYNPEIGVSSWEHLNVGTGGQTVQAIGVSAAEPNVVYLGLTGGSGPVFVLKSTTVTPSFSNTAAFPAGVTGVYSLSINPGNANEVTAGTNRGLFYSGDGGQNWEALNNGTLGSLPLLPQIRALHRIDNTLYAGSLGHGLFNTLLEYAQNPF